MRSNLFAPSTLCALLTLSISTLALPPPTAPSPTAGAAIASASMSSTSFASQAATSSAAPLFTGREGSNKYFHEPGNDDYSGHYDSRYFHGLVTDAERTTTLTHMIRAYLTWFREKGLETWIAHGTLLGWWWNGKMLPWDWDIDTQISGNTLQYLAAHYNRTLHSYISSDQTLIRTYLLDINPHSLNPSRADGQNIIDARWIDTTNGLYIDITVLRELRPDSEPGIWEDKNGHRYSTKELYPMRDSLYHGVPAQIPYAYDAILIAEYAEKALVTTEWEGHSWNPSQYEWVKMPEKETAKNGKELTA